MHWLCAYSPQVRLLAVSMFASTVGTNLMLVALSAHLYTQSSSNLAASGVYVAQFLPIVFLMPLAWRICNRLPLRSALVGLELVSGLVTIVVGLMVVTGWLWLAYVVLVARGFFDMTTKSARNVALKFVCTDGSVAQANNLVTAANFLGQTAGAVLGFVLIANVSILSIALIDAASFLLSALICLRLPSIRAVGAVDGGLQALWTQGKAALRADLDVMRAMIYLVGTVVLLQSFNQVARVGVPLAWLGLPPHAAALNEIIGTVAVVVGLVIVAAFFTGKKAHPPLWVFFCAAILSVVTPFLTKEPVGSFALYFAFMILFEMSFMISKNQLLARCRDEDTPCLMVIYYGVAFGGMTIATLGMAAAADLSGFHVVTAAIIAAGLSLAFFVERRVGPGRTTARPAQDALVR